MSAPAVAVSADASIFAVAWKDLREGEPNVYWAISDSPGFSSDEMVHHTTEGEQDHPSLAIDEQDTIWGAWEDSRVGKRQIWLRSSLDINHVASDKNDPKASFPILATGGGLVALVYESEKDGKKIAKFRLVKTLEAREL